MRRAGRSYVATAVALGILTLSGCAADTDLGDGSRKLAAGEDWGDATKYPEIGGAYHALLPLSGSCTFANGVVTVSLGTTAQTVIIGSRAVDSAILINDATCDTAAVPPVAATKTTMKRLVVSGNATATADIVILDFLGGMFAKGVASATAGGIAIDLGSDLGDELRIRGTTGNDAFYMGVEGLSFDTDAYRDISVTGTLDMVTVATADGNDVFLASNVPPTRGVTGSASQKLTLNGGLGNDTIVGGAAVDLIYGDEGNDDLNGGVGAAVDDNIFGEEGNDILSQSDTIDGNDALDCGADVDVVSYAARTNQIIATVAGTGGEGAEADVINVNCEGLAGGKGHDKLVGDAGDNTLSGNDGNDTLIGLDGNDTLNGGNGNDTFVESHGAGTTVAAADGTVGLVGPLTADNGGDTFNGNAGTDVVDYSARAAALEVTMDGAAADDGLAGEEDNVKADVENIVGGAGDDDITGNALSNVLVGGAGKDSLNGAAGDDFFSEGTGPSGGDTFIGGAGLDTLDYSARLAGVTVTMGDDTANDGEGGATEGDNCKGDVENIWGSDQVDTITGNNLDNIIDGKDGNDTLNGGPGNDRVDGGDPADDNDLDCGPGTDIGINNGTGSRTDCEV